MKAASLMALALAATSANAFVPMSRSLAQSPRPTTASTSPLVPSPPSSSSTSLSVVSGADLMAEGSMSQSLIKLLLETMIVNGVPALFTLLVIGFAAFQFRPRKGDMEDEDGMGFGMDPFGRKKNPAAELYSDLYEGDDSPKPMSPFKFFRMFKPQQTPAATNRGIPPKQYIQISNLNQKYDSYDWSLTAATQSKATAAAALRAKNFDRALRLAVNPRDNEDNGAASTTALSPSVKTTLLDLEKYFLLDGSKLLTTIQEAQAELTRNAIDEQMEEMGVELFELDPVNVTETANASKSAIKSKTSGRKAEKRQASIQATALKLAEAQTKLMKLELDFVRDVVATLGSERASGIRTALLGDISARGTGGLLTQLKDRPLSVLLQGGLSHANGSATTSDGNARKSLYVTRFPGDVQASQVAQLREEVTAIVRNAKPGDEAMLILQSGGGTVTGYGLAAAQLMRFKDAGMKLTVAVEQVAASGGYMMCCVADKIVSSPFAVLGSIGVISDIPNVYERLKKEGIEFQTVTAGKYKRTVTPTKQVTKEDLKKSKEDIEEIFFLFKQFVHQNRPSLDIEAVATGETWFGEDALARKLTDEIKTADEVLTEYVDGGWDVYEVAYKPPPEDSLALAGLPGSSAGDTTTGNFIRWLTRTLVREIKAELSESGIQQELSPEKRYLMVDDSADRIRSEYK